MQLKNNGTTVFGHQYAYDAMSRLATVGNGNIMAYVNTSDSIVADYTYPISEDGGQGIR